MQERAGRPQMHRDPCLLLPWQNGAACSTHSSVAPIAITKHKEQGLRCGEGVLAPALAPCRGQCPGPGQTCTSTSRAGRAGPPIAVELIPKMCPARCADHCQGGRSVTWDHCALATPHTASNTPQLCGRSHCGTEARQPLSSSLACSNCKHLCAHRAAGREKCQTYMPRSPRPGTLGTHWGQST